MSMCTTHIKKGGISELIDIPKPLTDDSGNKHASIIISLMLEKATLADTGDYYPTCELRLIDTWTYINRDYVRLYGLANLVP